MILFIGATGSTGRETARQIAGRVSGLRALVRNPAKAEPLREHGFELVAGDAGDAGSLADALRGADALFVSTTAEPELPQMHARIVDAAKEAGVRHIVKISATGAHPRAKFRFAAVHGESDQYIQRSGLRYTLLKPGYFMQNFLQSAGAIGATGALHLPIQSGSVALTDTRDIGAAAAEVLVNPEPHLDKAYELTGSDSMTGEQMAEAIARLTGRPIRFVSPDPDEFRAMLISYGVPEWSAAGLDEMYRIFAKGYAAKTTDAVQRLTQRDPITFEQFLQDHRRAFGTPTD